MLYYKEDGALARKLTFSDVREIDGRKIPTKMTMVPIKKKGHRTVVTYEKIQFDVSVPERLFTVANLRD